jgi:hypothetical protein
MPMLSAERIDHARTFIFKNGRLLERQLFEYFFGHGGKPACLKALFAYQNADGGFGNGIEPDILCPDSSAIGAETAMMALDMLDRPDLADIVDLIGWAAHSQNAAGVIDHPPANISRYPHQPWWENPDPARTLALAGLMKKWGVGDPAFLAGARRWFDQVKLPEEIAFYDYPYFIYLKYCQTGEEDRARFSRLVSQLPDFLSKHRAHFPLFSRYWCYAAEYVDGETLANEAAYFANAIHPDGNIDTPYPDFPWWNPIFLLDGLIALKKMGFL